MKIYRHKPLHLLDLNTVAMHTAKRKIKKRYWAGGMLLAYVAFCQSCMTMRMSPKKTSQFFAETETAFLDQKVSFPDHDMHYIQTGKNDKPTLLFVHGSPGSWDAFKNYLTDSLLLQKYRMIAIDRPGFGYSDFGQAENIHRQSQWILEFLETVDNKQPIILVGHSMGGPVIAKMATIYPKKFERLVILSGSLDPKAEKPENWRPLLMIRPLRYLVPGALRPSNDELWWLKQDLVDMEKELSKVTSKITIIHGTKDRLVPFSNVAFMEKAFSEAKEVNVIPIKDADHFIPWSHFEIVREALLQLH